MSPYCHWDREYLTGAANLSCSVFKLHAQCRIDLSQPNISSLFPSSQGSFSIEIRCSEYIPLTRCCQHWFPFLSEIWCWNPLQADKYLYTWLPDLIASCKSGLYWSHSQCMPHYIVFLFCYPILCPSQSPHLNKNISSMLGCSREAWWSIGGGGRQGGVLSAHCNRTCDLTKLKMSASRAAFYVLCTYSGMSVLPKDGRRHKRSRPRAFI